jgi:DNA replication protein DnaC
MKTFAAMTTTNKENPVISQTLLDKLLELRLPAFREGLKEQASNPQYAQLSFEERLLLLAEQECTRRSQGRFKRRLKLAEFPMPAAIEDLDFSPERGLERRLVLELAGCNWVDKALNILVLGATGTGKSFLACSLGVAACRLGYSVRYLRTSRFLHTLAHARQDGSYLNLLRSLNKIEVLILDDWMRDPILLSAAQDLLEVFDDRFGKTATLIASQVPVAEWHARFPDPTLADAILDRTIHNAYRLSLLGGSQRKLRGFRTMPHT